MNSKHAILALSVLTMVGCGSSEDDDPKSVALNDNGVPQLNEPKLSLKPLKSVQAQNFATHYKNGIYQSALNGLGYHTLEGAPVNTATDASTANSASTSTKFSSTITQEAGVDEADRIKYDGDYLYIANHAGYVWDENSTEGTQTAAHIRVMKRNADDNSMAEVESINIGDKDSYPTISGIYLSDDTLSVMSSSFSYGIADARFDIWHPGPQEFTVNLFNIENPSDAKAKAEFNIDGYVISSRRVDNTLIIVSSYSPYLQDLVYGPTTEEQMAANYDYLKKLDVSEILPKYTDQNGVEHPLVSADNCYIPEDATNKDGYDGIVTLTTINLDNPSQLSSVCVNSTTQGIYATPSSVYMYGSVDNAQSVIHKFKVNGQSIGYQSSTSFDGHLFGRGQSQLRFSEDGDYLRLVTTEFTEDSTDRFEHKLKVFKSDDSSTEMSLVAELPNESQPAKIGKPNEDIYAVRYFGKKAFIVTFESIDPLYVLDLSDNTAPKVASELEIVGYSSYLHPISENLILGIGQNVDPNRFQTTIDEATGTASVTAVTSSDEAKDDEKVVEGAKVALFDVSGDARLVKEFVFERGYTPAEYNYHALTYLAKSDTEHWFALPVETWNTTYSEELGYEVWSSTTNLQLFEVHDNGAGGDIENVGSVSPQSNGKNYYGSWDDRAIIHGDLIYYVHGRNVWQSIWTDPKNSKGPF